MLTFDIKIKNVTLVFAVVLKIKNYRKIIAVIQKIKPYDWSKMMMNEIITYYIPSAKFFIGNFFANERKHP
jgi:hypothetical protein